MTDSDNNQEIEVKIKLFKKLLDTTFSSFFNIIDYNELDLASFLSLKVLYNYNKYVIAKFFLIIASLIFYYLFLIILFPFSLIFVGIFILLLILYFKLDKISFKKFNYSIPYYQREKKALVKLQTQLELVLNNKFLETNFEKEEFKLYIEQYNEINKKIKTFSTVFKSYYDYLNTFGIYSFIFALITVIINIIYQESQITTRVITIDISVIISIIIIGFVVYDEIKEKVSLRYFSKKLVLKYRKILDMILRTFLIEFLKVLEFPDEEKLKEQIKNKLVKVLNKFKDLDKGDKLKLDELKIDELLEYLSLGLLFFKK